MNSPDVIIKLFDTLKDATNKNENTMQTLINQQSTLVEHVKHLPIEEIKTDIKDHVKSAQEERKDIADKVDKTDSRVVKMIIVVVVAFTLFSSAILIAKLVDDPQPSHTAVIETYEKQIDDLRKQIDDFHSHGSETPDSK